MKKPLPFVEIQKVIHYAMPLIDKPGRVNRQSICGISSLIPGRRVKQKDTKVACKACKAVAAQVWGHTKGD